VQFSASRTQPLWTQRTLPTVGAQASIAAVQAVRWWVCRCM